MYGDRDLIMSPKKSIEMAEKIPNSRIESFRDVGHGFWREKQDEVDKIVMDFLS